MSGNQNDGTTKLCPSKPVQPSPSTISVESKITPKMKKYLKLIDLYHDHECLWHQCNKDFFNFELKEEAWQEIAKEMDEDSDPDDWKYLIYKLSYNVEQERIHQQEALFQRDIELPPKLKYSENLQFLKNKFDRKWCKTPLTTDTSTPHRSNCFMMLDSVEKDCSTGLTSYASKLKELEHLRNTKGSTYVLSLEAFHKTQDMLQEKRTSSQSIEPNQGGNFNEH